MFDLCVRMAVTLALDSIPAGETFRYGHYGNQIRKWLMPLSGGGEHVDRNVIPGKERTK